jgi:hypothetical protein
MLKCKISLKSVRWQPNCSTWMGGETDMMKLIVALTICEREGWGGGGGGGGNVTEHEKCILIFSETFVWNIFHFKKY